MTRTLIDAVALSPLQRGLYALSMTAGDWDPYLVRFALRCDGVGDLARLRRAWEAMGRRHPQLAGSVRSDGLPHPVLLMAAEDRIGWHDVDLRSDPNPAAAARTLYQAQAHRRIDFDHGPLMRVTAARVTDDTYELICTAHHIVVDGWSIPLMVADVVACYGADGADPGLPDPVPLRTHAAWVAGKNVDESSQVWRAELAGLADMAMLGPVVRSGVGEPVIGEHVLTTAQTTALSEWAKANGLTMNTLMQLAWARVLSGVTGSDDVVFGQTTSGRDATLAGADRIVGGLVTTIPVRVRVDERSPAQAGRELQTRVAALRRHEYLGTAAITRAAGIGSLFDTLLVFENAPTDAIADGVPMADGGRLTPHRVESPSHYPLAVVPVLDGDRLVVRTEVRPDMTDTYPADRLAQRFATVLQRLISTEKLCRVDVLTADEPAALVAADAASAGHGQATGVETVLALAAGRVPDAVAVVDSAGEHTFGQFIGRVRAMAGGLAARHVVPGEMVAVMLPRTVDVLAAPFAVAMTGAVCVHVDPDTPADRLGHILETSGARLVLAAADSAPRVARAADELAHSVTAVTPADLCAAPPGALPRVSIDAARRPLYAVFTSGTTGRPKGVLVTHQNLLQHWATHESRIFASTARALGRSLRVGHGWSTGFDAAWQPTVALLSGHTVVLLDDETRVDAEATVAAIAAHDIDVFDTSPSMLKLLIAAGLFRHVDDGVADRCRLAVLALGGEAIGPDLWQRLAALPSTRVINFYGPTETTVEVFMATVADHGAPTLGRPFHTVGAQVLDHRLRPVPPGTAGELYIAGDQVACGYLGRAGLTATTFVAADGGRRRYRTGDLVLRNVDDTVAFAGRIDDQVKINGYRVEPADAAAVLAEIDGVSQAEVLAYAENGRTRLGALLVTDRAPAQVRADLADRVPAYLVPSRFAVVDAIPLTRNDKLDVAAATAVLAAAVTPEHRTAPRTDTERSVIEVLARIAGTPAETIGCESTLADLGIDSIGIMEVAAALRTAGFALSARNVAEAADVAALAVVADGDLDGQPAAEDATAPASAGTRIPLRAFARDAVLGNALAGLAHVQAIRIPASVDRHDIDAVLTALALAHPTLRSTLHTRTDSAAPDAGGSRGSGSYLVVADEPRVVWVDAGPDVHGLPRALVEQLDPAGGTMVAVAVAEPGVHSSDRLLLIAIHHLATDAVSWRILFADLAAIVNGVVPLNEQVGAQHDESDDDTVFEKVGAGDVIANRHADAPLGSRHSDPHADRADAVLRRSEVLVPARTEALLAASSSGGGAIVEILTRACAEAVRTLSGAAGPVTVTRETHGRSLAEAQRVGWFTTEEQVVVSADGDITSGPAAACGEVRLNYLGRLDQTAGDPADWAPLAPHQFSALFGAAGTAELPQRFAVDVLASVVVGDSQRPELIAHLTYNANVLTPAHIDRFHHAWSQAVTTEKVAN